MKTFKYFSLILGFFLALASLSAGLARPALETSGDYPSQANMASEGMPTDQLIIKYKAIASAQLEGPNRADALERLSSVAGIQLAYFRPMSGDAHVLRLPEALLESEVERIAALLSSLPDVEYAEADTILFPALEPNDPLYVARQQWNLSEAGLDHYGIDAPAAWDIITGTSDVVVAVIDTGITDHPDLDEKMVAGTSQLPSGGYDFVSDSSSDSIDSDNDGVEQDGRDNDPHDPGDWTVDNECGENWFARDSSWHGTHVAGIIGAATNNDLGVAGINWNARILPVRVLGKCGGLSSDIVDGMRWAAGLPVASVPVNPNPARVLNLSLSGKNECGETYQNAINDILMTGATVVVSAGNYHEDASLYRPGNCNGVITVAATERNGLLASTYSNFGSVVALSAPGGSGDKGSQDAIFSTLNTGKQGPVSPTYQSYIGTSMSAPHVSGVASLLYSLNPNITSAQVLQVLQQTVIPFTPSSNNVCTTGNCGTGILNAGNAVKPLILSLSPDAIQEGSPTTVLTVNGANFMEDSTIYFDGDPHLTDFVNSTTLSTTLAASELISRTHYAVTVNAIRPSGVYTSTPVTLTVGINRVYLPLLVHNLGWSTVLFDDFEDGLSESWAVTDTANIGYTWAARDCVSYQGNFSAWAVGGGSLGSGLGCTSLYPNNVKAWMTYGPFSLEGALVGDVHSQLFLNTEDLLDSVCLMASKDGFNFFGECYSGNHSIWEEKTLDLSNVPTLGNLLGEPQVWVAVHFKSDASTARPGGAYVDNFLVRKCLGSNQICSLPVSSSSDAASLFKYPFEAQLK